MIEEILNAVHGEVQQETGGNVATYIPELGKANPDNFGLALTTLEGRVYEVGDTTVPFSIQSMSKPFTFALALQELGTEAVYRRVGVEPSGDDFNSIVLDPQTGTPPNPMVNSGAIAMTGLLRDKHGDDAFDYIHDMYGKFAGSPLGIDESVYQSEQATDWRNRAMAYLMRSSDVVCDPVEEVVDLYTRQCALTVTTEQLASMAATIANVGVNPRTDEVVLDALVVRQALSVMFTCGMYNYSGSWALNVGLPAKSGVAGGVFAVVNRQLGIATYSPPLDERGNSVRGIKACAMLAEELGLHAFELANAGSALLDIYLKAE